MLLPSPPKTSHMSQLALPAHQGWGDHEPPTLGVLRRDCGDRSVGGKSPGPVGDGWSALPAAPAFLPSPSPPVHPHPLPGLLRPEQADREAGMVLGWGQPDSLGSRQSKSKTGTRVTSSGLWGTILKLQPWPPQRVQDRAGHWPTAVTHSLTKADWLSSLLSLLPLIPIMLPGIPSRAVILTQFSLWVCSHRAPTKTRDHSKVPA